MANLSGGTLTAGRIIASPDKRSSNKDFCASLHSFLMTVSRLCYADRSERLSDPMLQEVKDAGVISRRRAARASN